MTVPLSDAQLAEIRERAVAATQCPKTGGEHAWSGSSFTHVECAECHFVRPRGERAEETVELLAEVDRLRAQLAAEPAQPSPEHQAIYLDDYDQVWCDYPTVPADDQVLPLVWASEVAQSRRDLADGGNKLRVIGWCR